MVIITEYNNADNHKITTILCFTKTKQMRLLMHYYMYIPILPILFATYISYVPNQINLYHGRILSRAINKNPVVTQTVQWGFRR